MAKIVIKKSPPLQGEVTVSTSKNAVLPIIAASILTDEDIIIYQTPKLTDVMYMLRILRGFGAYAKYEKGTLLINSRDIHRCEGLLNSVKRLRSSFLFMGPLLTKTGCVRMPMPGGCRIGIRPIDLHVRGLQRLGADIITKDGWVIGTAKRLKGTDIYLDYPSVGATENIMMAAVLAEGTTTIKNAASEPEIADLANFLNRMGARVGGAGTNNIRIRGVKRVKGTAYTPIPDRIEAGTMMMAGAINGGDIVIKNADLGHLTPLSSKLMEAGAEIHPLPDAVRVTCKRPLKAQSVTASPYPGFPTDLQAQFAALAATMRGTSIIMETVFENRFMYAAELIKMGADIRVEGRTAVVRGIDRLNGATVKATDLRAGAALILAGLAADNETVIEDIYHIDRGYEKIEEKLRILGADIVRI